jgi:tetratricopeptide (TPR) repeat protein
MRKYRSVLALIPTLFIAAALRAAQVHQHMPADAAASPALGAHLGQVHFATSCAPAAQAAFDEGVALLHSFQYEASDQAFRRASSQDPNCAMAHWGEAMTMWHELWERPGASTLSAGLAEVRKAESLSAKTARERGYIAAVAAFYQDDPKFDFAARAAAYSRAMESVYEQNPKDGDAAAFYALSLIAQPAKGATDLANREKAIAILKPLFAAEPNHPGAAHYLIHACDTPELAPQGLAAARRYAQIAPDSAHALHMPSHIFTRLGLWQESIASNIASAAAAAKATKEHLGDAHYQLHAMTFLEYAYLQSGREAKAKELIGEVRSVPGVTPAEIADTEAIFRARYALETHDWKMAAALDPATGGADAQDMTWWVKTIGAARSGAAVAARADLEKLDGEMEASQSVRAGYGAAGGMSIEQLEGEAWVEWAEGRSDDGVKTLRKAADREDAEGVDSLTMPAREMLGDMLMEAKQPASALEAYQTALKESPNRRDGLRGQELAMHAASGPARATPSARSE